jgi:hypothetical protein
VIFFFSLLETCSYGDWFNTDTNPGDRGDIEYIEYVVKAAQNKRVKSCRYPEEVKVRKQGVPKSDQIMFKFTSRSTRSWTVINPNDADDTQQVTGDTITGFSCTNADQTGGKTCSDYEIKLCCPGKFFKDICKNYRMIKYNV